jgi:GTP-binding protein EngB required for normal cell division
MTTLVAQFQDVLKLYLSFCEDLTKIMDVGDSKDPRALAESILQNRDCLDRIAQMNLRILRLSDDWDKCRKNLDSKSLDDVRNFAQAAKAQAVRLKELCSTHAQKLQTARDKLATDLAEIGKGAQYLKSIKPIKNNYPKFIDSQW